MAGFETFVVQGRLDAVQTGNVEMRCFASMAGAGGAGTPFLVDLRQTEFIASLGLRFLVLAAKTAAQRQLRLGLLVPPTGPVRETMDLAGMGNVAPMFDTVEAALAALRG